MHKTLICACEDVTAHYVDEAVERGLGDVESVKRYTGLGTGPCQGKSCVVGLKRHLAKCGGPKMEQPFTARPPIVPTEFAVLAGMAAPGKDGESDSVALHSRPQSGPCTCIEPATTPWMAGSSPGSSPGTAMTKGDEHLPHRVDILIIGGGIMGLALAYGLTRRGVRDVLVLERGYLCEGASGRNGGGVRMQWTTAPFIELCKESIGFMRHFAQELGINVWLRQGGYLFTARTAAEARAAEQRAEFQRRHGVRTEILTPTEARSIVPDLDDSQLVAAAYHPEDGVVFPWPFLWGYADGARRGGARVETFTGVEQIEIERGEVRGVVTNHGRVAATTVVIAAGAWSVEVARLAGVTLPNVPMRHEILVTEPLKPFLDPLVSELSSGLYFSQSMRGEIVGGMGDPAEPPGLNQTSSARFAARFAEGVTRLIPRLGGVKVIRQWAGCYDVTPDHSPILGETPGVRGLVQMSGFVGHGFMMAPAVAERMADWLAGGPIDEVLQRYALSRFAEGRLEHEEMIIG